MWPPKESRHSLARAGAPSKKCAAINFLDGEAAGVNWSEAGYLNGAQGRDRTTDTAIFSRMLYQLSYLGTSRAGAQRAPVYSQAGQPCPAWC